ncbi:hypothetical protein [uncultured Desulfosarcina sp.]|uniref:hypothetical protein n=1 Tax=uncultured Desulfosarcina sp. TaxID=218289 RepID=UPI0029C643F1|nr:hypothetical protein [uncultured Desulfosarcina sp.]
MNDYQQEQLEALRIVRQGLARMDESDRGALKNEIGAYDRFRQTVDAFLQRHFSGVCTRLCYQSRTSACCSKDGIITFFADAVVNALHAAPEQLDRMEAALQQVNSGHRCVYLADDGCIWAVRPVVCAMFLCDRAMETVFKDNPQAREQWQELRSQEKTFKWPDRPVLFDHLEKVFIDMGYRSSLMHLNFSPGLLMVKKKAGLL